MNESPIIQDLRRIFRGEMRPNEPMSLHTSFRIGGPALALLLPRDVDDLIAATHYAHKSAIPYYVIGAGSKLLVMDEGVDGLVIKMGHNFGSMTFQGQNVTAEAGVRLSALAREAIRRGLGGLEALAGIPGTVGGAVAMNAGAFSQCIGDVLEGVVALNWSGETRLLSRQDLRLGYRTSALQGTYIPPQSVGDGRTDESPPHGPVLICLKAMLRLNPGNPKELAELEEAFLEKRKRRQPLDVPSAGSVFKNPPGLSAGRLIEQAGCKGLTYGGAAVSPTHANFIINKGGATAQDVLHLIREIKRRVFEKSGVDLELEIRVLGESVGLEGSDRRCS
ncbi:MAG TPA: UDP-N-acetylmuramate dehydrogenase [Clostridia bacterium]|nr:UDP-N-acetylmuramate dehydrogenase [Clostridia bacterium]